MVVSYREHPDVAPGQHWVSNTLLEGGGEKASGRSDLYCIMLAADGESLELDAIGRYRDEFEKVDGHWLIRRRTITDVRPTAVSDFSLDDYATPPG